jgi:hypothetical protein
MFFRIWVFYLIKEYLEALDMFKIFKSKVENQPNLKLKVVRLYHSGEYYGKHTLYS